MRGVWVVWALAAARKSTFIFIFGIFSKKDKYALFLKGFKGRSGGQEALRKALLSLFKYIVVKKIIFS